MNGNAQTAGVIQFRGNRSFTDNDLLRQMNRAPGPWFSRAQMDSLVERVLQKYRSAGFYQADIDAQWSPDSSGIALDIREGRRFLAGRIGLDGNRFLGAKFLSDLLRTKPGAVLDSATLADDLARISQTYADNGFPHAEVSLAGFQLSQDSVDFSYRIEEGPRVLVNRIGFEGNTVTKPLVAAKISGLRPNEVFDRRKVERAEKNLLRSELFMQVDQPYLVATAEEGKEDLFFRVVEGRYNTFYGALGYNQGQASQKGWLAGTVDLRLKNIAGTARKFFLHWERPRRETTQLEAFYHEPWLWLVRAGADIALNHRIQDSSFTQTTGRATLQIPLSDDITAGAGLGIERVVPGSSLQVKRSLTYSSLWSLQADFRRGFQLRYGPWYRLEVDYGRKIYYQPSSQLTVSRILFDGLWLVPVARGQAWFTGLHGRALVSSEHPAPRCDQFTLGGARSLRGYLEEQFIAGRLLWCNIEYRFLPASGFECYPFCDAGYYRDADRGLQGFRMGYGAGFRLNTRLGWISVDYGLGKGDKPLDGKVHLGLESIF